MSPVSLLLSDPTLLLDRFEALAEISALCAALAARRTPTGDMHRLEDLISRMEDADRRAYLQMSFFLHDRIYLLTKNADLSRMATDIRSQLAPLWPIWPEYSDWRQRSMHEHRALVESICDRDEDQAAVIMRGHLRAIAREVLFNAGICPTNPV